MRKSCAPGAHSREETTVSHRVSVWVRADLVLEARFEEEYILVLDIAPLGLLAQHAHLAARK